MTPLLRASTPSYGATCRLSLQWAQCPALQPSCPPPNQSDKKIGKNTCQYIIKHYTPSPFYFLIYQSDGKWFKDVKKTERQKTYQQETDTLREIYKSKKYSGNFVNYNMRTVFCLIYLLCLTGDINACYENQNYNYCIYSKRYILKEKTSQDTNEAANCSRCYRKVACKEA